MILCNILLNSASNLGSMKKTLAFAVLVLSGIIGMAQSPNTLTNKEKKEGWKLLFDGQTTAGWRNYNSDKVGPGWKVAGNLAGI